EWPHILHILDEPELNWLIQQFVPDGANDNNNPAVLLIKYLYHDFLLHNRDALKELVANWNEQDEAAYLTTEILKTSWLEDQLQFNQLGDQLKWNDQGTDFRYWLRTTAFKASKRLVKTEIPVSFGGQPDFQNQTK